MSITAIVYYHIEDINLWTSSTLNNILTIGNNLYTSIRCSVQTNDYLLLTDVPCIVSIYNKVYTLEYSESLTGSLFMTSNNGPYMSLQNSLTEVVSNCQLNYKIIVVCGRLELILEQRLRIQNKALKFFMLIPGICMGCPTHLRNVLCLPLKELKTVYHI